MRSLDREALIRTTIQSADHNDPTILQTCVSGANGECCLMF